MINKNILSILFTCFLCIATVIVSFFLGKYILEKYIFGNIFKLSNNEMVKKAWFLNWNWILHLAVLIFYFTKNHIKFRWLIFVFVGFYLIDNYSNIGFYFDKYLSIPLFEYISIKENLFEIEYIKLDNIKTIFSTYLINWFFNTLSIFYLTYCLFEMLLYKRIKYVSVSCAWCGNTVLVSKDWSGGQIICSNCSRARSQGRI